MKHHEYEISETGLTEVRTITFGSFLEETPEGLFRMDRIRRAAEAERAAMQPWERDLHDSVNAEVDKAVLGL